MDLKLFALKNAVLHDGKAAAGAIVSKALGADPSLKSDMKTLMIEINKAISEVNKMDLEKQKKELLKLDRHALDKKEEVRELPEIPGIKKGKCSFRLPPGPEKELHIGHAMSFLLNDYYAKKYEGKLILRFEDTNPEKSALEFVKGIRDDLAALGIKYDEEYFLSDNMLEYYKLAEKMMKDGAAYACVCPKKSDDNEGFEKKRCNCANNDVNWSLRHWNKMKYGTYREGECVIRLKGKMDSKNTALWDPVLFRINKTKHYRQGGKYFIWPTYDFTASIEDSKITHVLRDSNWTQRVELQNLIRESCGIKKHPENVLYSRYQLENGVTQGRVIRKMVEDKIAEGYDDIRLSTVKGILRKGILPETLRELLVELGITKSKKTIPLDKIYSINRKHLEKIAKHFQAIKSGEEAKLIVNNCPKSEDNEFIIARPGKEIREFRLKNSFNAKVLKINGNEIIADYAGTELIKGIPIVSWVKMDSVKIKVLEALPLFDEKGEINKDSLKTLELIADKDVESLSIGSIAYFEKFGYCKKEENQWIFCHD